MFSLFRNEHAAGENEEDANPAYHRNLFVEKYHSRKHAHDVSETDHRVSHAEREVLDDVHPKDRGGSVAYTT